MTMLYIIAPVFYIVFTMLTIIFALIAGAGGLFWLYSTRDKQDVRPKTPEAAKRERMQSSPHDSDLRAMRVKNSQRAQFGRR